MARNYQPRSLGPLGRSDGMSRAMQQAAQVGQRWAESVAPHDSGTYRDSFRVAPTEVRGGRSRERRAGARLANDATYAIVVESRTSVMARSVNVIERGR